MTKAKIFHPKRVFIFIFLLFAAQGCQEFIHDSFDTFQGVIVDQSGDPIPNLRLRLFSESSSLNIFNIPNSSLIYTLSTDNQGAFKVVVPSRNIDNFYLLEVPETFRYDISQSDLVISEEYLQVDSSLKDANGVIDLGEVTLIQP